jgi:magnesium transporter
MSRPLIHRRLIFQVLPLQQRGVTTKYHSFSTPEYLNGGTTKFKVSELSIEGAMTTRNMQTHEIIQDSSIYARDLLSLQLTTKQDRFRPTNSSTSAILPRGNEILLSFGAIRAVVGTQTAWIFDIQSPAVQDFSHEMQRILKREWLSSQHRSGEVKYTFCQPFEMVFLEAVLRETTEVFHRRLKLYEPIVDSFLGKVTAEVFSEIGVHQLVPLKDSLQGFELQVNQCLECLTHLLNNDEDMLALLITEQEIAKREGTMVEFDRHRDVELLLEEYARQLNTILSEIQYSLKRLQSKQEFVHIALSSYRNRLIRTNLYIAISGLSLGIGTTVAGFFGMNLVSGFEAHPSAFYWVLGGATWTGVAVAVACFNFVSGHTMQVRAEKRLEELETLTSALSDMNALDVTIKRMLSSPTKSLTREEFAKRLREARITNVTDREVDLLFDALDQQKDGILQDIDFEALEQLQKEQQSKLLK